MTTEPAERKHAADVLAPFIARLTAMVKGAKASPALHADDHADGRLEGLESALALLKGGRT